MDYLINPDQQNFLIRKQIYILFNLACQPYETKKLMILHFTGQGRQQGFLLELKKPDIHCLYLSLSPVLQEFFF